MLRVIEKHRPGFSSCIREQTVKKSGYFKAIKSLLSEWTGRQWVWKGIMHRYIRNLFLGLVIIAYPICPASASETSLVINEFMASNNSCLQDPQGQYDDWIEIHNFGSNPINVGGMYLTDDLSFPTKWQIPNNNPNATVITRRQYLLIWADNDTTDAGLHTNFKLGADGEQIALFDSDGSTLIDSITFPAQTTDISYGRYPDATVQPRSRFLQCGFLRHNRH